MELVPYLILLATFIVSVLTLFNLNKGFNLMLLMTAFFSFLGSSVGIAQPFVILPIIITIGLIINYISKNNQVIFRNSLSTIGVLLFVYAILITIIKGGTFWGEPNRANVFFAFFMFMVAPKLLVGNLSSLSVISLIWLNCAAQSIFILVFSENALTFASLYDRAYVVEDRVFNTNYLGMINGLGFLISIIYLQHPNAIDSFFNFKRNSLLKLVVFLIAILEFWLLIKGLSRGALISILSALFYLFIIKKQYRKSIILVIFGFVLYFLFDPVWDLYLVRFTDGSSDDRTLIWNDILNLKKENGLVSIIFGDGSGYPWWEGLYDNAYSAHSTYFHLLIEYGLVGLLFFVYILSRSFFFNFKKIDFIGICKSVLIIYLFIFSFTAITFGPFISIITLALVSTYNNRNNKNEQDIFKRYTVKTFDQNY